MKITVTKEQLAILSQLVFNSVDQYAVLDPQTGKSKLVHVDSDLIESAYEWMTLAAGACVSCSHNEQRAVFHPVNDDGTCGLTEANMGEYGYT